MSTTRPSRRRAKTQVDVHTPLYMQHVLHAELNLVTGSRVILQRVDLLIQVASSRWRLASYQTDGLGFQQEGKTCRLVGEMAASGIN